MITLMALEQGKNPVVLSELYRSAMTEILDRGNQIDLGVNPSTEIASVFPVDWTGIWLAETQSRSVHKFKTAVRLSFDIGKDGNGQPQTFPEVADGDSMRFEHALDTGHRYA